MQIAETKNKKSSFSRCSFCWGIAFFLVILIFGVSVANASGGIVPCGGTGQSMCTICDLIKGLNDIIQYLLRIAVGLALTIFTVAGVMYIVSVGNSGTTEMAKNAMKNAIIGFVIILVAWLAIDILLNVVGAKADLGITGVTKWGTFDCNATN